MKGVDYLICSRLAELLNKETSNLYLSFKRRKVGMWRASEALVEFLVSSGSVASGASSSSVTLVRLDQVQAYVDEVLECRAAKRQKKMGRINDLILALQDDFAELLASSTQGTVVPHV